MYNNKAILSFMRMGISALAISFHRIIYVITGMHVLYSADIRFCGEYKTKNCTYAFDIEIDIFIESVLYFLFVVVVVLRKPMCRT